MVALGGSTTYGMYFWRGEDVWPQLVVRFLEVAFPDATLEMINAGVPNYSTFELLGMASMWVPELDADIVLVHTGLNDAFTVGYPDEGGPDNTGFRHSWTYRPLPGPARALMRRSWFCRALGVGWLSRGGHMVGGMSDAMQYPAPDDEQVRRLAPAATGKYFRRNLVTLIALIRGAGAEPVLVEMPLNPGMEQGLGVYYDAVSAAVLRNNRIMAEVAADRGVLLVPLYDRMRDPAQYKDAAHLGQEGMLLKAKLVAEGIVPLVGSRLGSAPGGP
jgi:lysophospholipase L1-like esterase